MEIDNQPNQQTGSNPPQPPVGGPTSPQGPEPTPQGPLPPLPENQSGNDQYQQPTHTKTDVLGIISLVMIFIFPLVGMILGFIGIGKAKKEGYPKTLSMIGAIVNTILVVLGAIVIGLIVMATMNSSTDDYSQELDEFNQVIEAIQQEDGEVTYISDVGNICATKQWPTNLAASVEGNVVGVFSNSQSYPDIYSREYVSLEDSYEEIDSSSPAEVDTLACVSSVNQEPIRVVECDLTIDDEEVKAPMSLRPYQVTVYNAESQEEIGSFIAQPVGTCPFFVTVDPEDNSFDARMDEASFNSGFASVAQ